MEISEKTKKLCAEYLDLMMQINSYEAFVSTDSIKTASNFYSLGSRYRELYAVIVKLSMQGYVQTSQIDDLINQYKNTYGYSTSSSSSN